MAEERITPDQVGGHNTIEYQEHLARYAFAQKFIQEGSVGLDIACGAGYGTDMLLAGTHAKKMTGVDISEEAIAYAKQHFNDKRLEFIKYDAAEIIFPKSSFGVIVSFETIEHLEQNKAAKLIGNLYNYLKDDGTLIMSCPNRETYPSGYTPNPYHIHEYSYEEIRDALNNHFKSIDLYCQGMRYFNRAYKKPAQFLKHLPKSIVSAATNIAKNKLQRKGCLKDLSPFFRILLYENVYTYDVFPFVEDYAKCRPVSFIFVCRKNNM